MISRIESSFRIIRAAVSLFRRGRKSPRPIPKSKAKSIPSKPNRPRYMKRSTAAPDVFTDQQTGINHPHHDPTCAVPQTSIPGRMVIKRQRHFYQSSGDLIESCTIEKTHDTNDNLTTEEIEITTYLCPLCGCSSLIPFDHWLEVEGHPVRVCAECYARHTNILDKLFNIICRKPCS